MITCVAIPSGLHNDNDSRINPISSSHPSAISRRWPHEFVHRLINCSWLPDRSTVCCQPGELTTILRVAVMIKSLPLSSDIFEYRRCFLQRSRYGCQETAFWISLKFLNYSSITRSANLSTANSRTTSRQPCPGRDVGLVIAVPWIRAPGSCIGLGDLFLVPDAFTVWAKVHVEPLKG